MASRIHSSELKPGQAVPAALTNHQPNQRQYPAAASAEAVAWHVAEPSVAHAKPICLGDLEMYHKRTSKGSLRISS